MTKTFTDISEIRSVEDAVFCFTHNIFTPVQLVEFYLKNITEKNQELNVYLEVFADEARAAAVEAAERYKNGTARRLEGVPIAIKDCLLVQGKTATAGSKMIENFTAAYDATAVRLLKEFGAIILGRTNMDEFALGGSGENSAYGPTKNPISTDRVPGGTSSGSAAAVAAEMCLFALGTDTGGSVRQPGSFCGVCGFKPSYGGVSRNGLIAAASSLDTVGVLAHDVDTVKTVYEILGKEDVLDGTSIPLSVREEKSKTPFKKKIAYPKAYIESEGVNKEVKENFYATLEKMSSLGYEVVPVEIPTLDYALSAYYIINTAEVSTNLSRFDGLRFGGGDIGEFKGYEELYKKTRGKFFGKEVKRRIMLGSYVLSHGYYDAYYGKATLLRSALRSGFEKIFKEFSIILTPTAPTTAFEFNAQKTPLEMYLEDIFTVPANLIGIPGISVPTGFDSLGLPFGVQALADFGCDEHVFLFARDVAQK